MIKSISFIFLIFIYFPFYSIGDTNSPGVQIAQASVVQVTNPHGTAIGFYVGQNLLVTNYHVATDSNGVIPIDKFHIGQNTQSSVKVTGFKALSALYDLAVLEVKGYNGPSLSLGDLIENEKIYLFGYPEGQSIKITGKNVKQRGMNYIFSSDLYEMAGVSGSPLLNSKGQIIGIFHSLYAGSFSIAVKAVHLQRILEKVALNTEETSNGQELYRKTIDEIHRIAEEGNAEAQDRLGYIYEYGVGVKHNRMEAMKWYRKAAIQGDAQAQYRLGRIYKDMGNVTEAMKWYRKAAAQKYAMAEFNIGNMYQEGLIGGGRENLERAIKHYKRAGAGGHAVSFIMLGHIYINGEKGIRRNYKIATKYYKKALELTPHPIALFNLGTIYENGFGVEQSDAEARQLYEKAAAQGLYEALIALERLNIRRGRGDAPRCWHGF